MRTSKIIFTILAASIVAGAGARADETAAPAPNEVLYVQQLPSPAELANIGKAEGATVVQIDQTSDYILAVYKNANGQITTVEYKPMSAADSSTSAPAAVVATPTTPAPDVTGSNPTVIYTQPAPVYYYPAGYCYYPYGWYPPVSVRFGFGLGFHDRDRFHGGFHGRWR